MMKYPSNAPEIKCDIICKYRHGLSDKIRRTISRISYEFYKEYQIAIPVTLTTGCLIDPTLKNRMLHQYTLSTKADSIEYNTHHAIDHYVSLSKDMLIEIAKELGYSEIEITVVGCITDKYICKKKGGICNI